MAYEGTKLADFTPSKEPVRELEIIDIKEGTGAEVPKGATITAHYTGALVKMALFSRVAMTFSSPARLDLIR